MAMLAASIPYVNSMAEAFVLADAYFTQYPPSAGGAVQYIAYVRTHTGHYAEQYFLRGNWNAGTGEWSGYNYPPHSGSAASGSGSPLPPAAPQQPGFGQSSPWTGPPPTVQPTPPSEGEIIPPSAPPSSGTPPAHEEPPPFAEPPYGGFSPIGTVMPGGVVTPISRIGPAPRPGQPVAVAPIGGTPRAPVAIGHPDLAEPIDTEYPGRALATTLPHAARNRSVFLCDVVLDGLPSRRLPLAQVGLWQTMSEPDCVPVLGLGLGGHVGWLDAPLGTARRGIAEAIRVRMQLMEYETINASSGVSPQDGLPMFQRRSTLTLREGSFFRQSQQTGGWWEFAPRENGQFVWCAWKCAFVIEMFWGENTSPHQNEWSAGSPESVFFQEVAYAESVSALLDARRGNYRADAPSQHGFDDLTVGDGFGNTPLNKRTSVDDLYAHGSYRVAFICDAPGLQFTTGEGMWTALKNQMRLAERDPDYPGQGKESQRDATRIWSVGNGRFLYRSFDDCAVAFSILFWYRGSVAGSCELKDENGRVRRGSDGEALKHVGTTSAEWATGMRLRFESMAHTEVTAEGVLVYFPPIVRELAKVPCFAYLKIASRPASKTEDQGQRISNERMAAVPFGLGETAALFIEDAWLQECKSATSRGAEPTAINAMRAARAAFERSSVRTIIAGEDYGPLSNDRRQAVLNWFEGAIAAMTRGSPSALDGWFKCPTKYSELVFRWVSRDGVPLSASSLEERRLTVWSECVQWTASRGGSDGSQGTDIEGMRSKIREWVAPSKVSSPSTLPAWPPQPSL